MSIIYTDKDGIDHKTAGKEVPGIASNTDFGVVQFTDSKGVTSDNGLALSAKEKNKDISGTLAAEINTVSAKLGDANIAAGDGTAAGAINELNQKLTPFLSDFFKVVEVSFAGSAITPNVKFGINKDVPLPSGYKVLGISGYNLTRDKSINFTGVVLSGNQVSVQGVSTEITTFAGFVYVLCVKNIT